MNTRYTAVFIDRVSEVIRDGVTVIDDQRPVIIVVL